MAADPSLFERFATWTQSGASLPVVYAAADLVTALSCFLIGATLVLGLRRRRVSFPAQGALAPLAFIISLFGFGAVLDLLQAPGAHHLGQVWSRALIAVCAAFGAISLRPGIAALLAMRAPEELDATRLERDAALEARARAEAELHCAREELARTVRELDQHNLLVVQGLQEPLRVISGFSQLLVRRHRPRLEGDARDFLDYIDRGTRRLQSQIRNLQSLSRIGGAGRFDRRPLGETLERALNAQRNAIDESGAQIVVGPLPEIEADHGMLARLLQQLIGNSIKARRTNQRPRIELKLEREGTDWLLQVADNGVGIAPDRLETVFELTRLAQRDDGSGLGLPLARRIAAHHGGALWATSDGEGARFHLRLPVKPGSRARALLLSDLPQSTDGVEARSKPKRLGRVA